MDSPSINADFSVTDRRPFAGNFSLHPHSKVAPLNSSEKGRRGGATPPDQEISSFTQFIISKHTHN
ncbi:hypothetical protein OF001_U300012 [Pseudomonas sp. OF001]|nr:hypothetical protein OF001_U300012 [Pseudomonas sp. OF001]